LYGCLQSAKLWFELLVKELIAFGYEQNAVDPCVLNRVVDGKQSTLLLHVDDIMVLSEIAGESKQLYAYLESKFGKVALHEGVKHNYLGMTFDFHPLVKFLLPCSDMKLILSMTGLVLNSVLICYLIVKRSRLLPRRMLFSTKALAQC
jgi:hypothetical protein